MEQLLELTDDARFMGLVDADAYSAYLHPDVEFEELQEHLLAQCSLGHLLFWGTSLPNHWNVRISDHPSQQQAERSTEGIIEVTGNGLYLVSYQDLLDAAQYNDALDASNRGNWHIPLEPSFYQVQIRQLFNPERDAVHEEYLGFEIVLSPLSCPPSQPLNAQWRPLPWSAY